MQECFRETAVRYGLPVKERYTYEDYARLPEGAPLQLIGGKLVMTPAPGKTHQQVVKKLFRLLDDYVEQQKGGEVHFAPRDVELAPHEVYQPDILFISRERLAISTEDKVAGAPDLVVEVLSPATAYYDLRKKFRAYERYGVREYWIADPEEKSIEVYALDGGKFVLASRAEVAGEVASQVLAGLTVDVGKVFGGQA
ncbi:Uma2 family endonuclease [Thermosinus carboxydivorans]|nr:Uma2 family endonuclease [Thermosinus carboxydivorans]